MGQYAYFEREAKSEDEQAGQELCIGWFLLKREKPHQILQHQILSEIHLYGHENTAPRLYHRPYTYKISVCFILKVIL